MLFLLLRSMERHWLSQQCLRFIFYFVLNFWSLTFLKWANNTWLDILTQDRNWKVIEFIYIGFDTNYFILILCRIFLSLHFLSELLFNREWVGDVLCFFWGNLVDFFMFFLFFRFLKLWFFSDIYFKRLLMLSHWYYWRGSYEGFFCLKSDRFWERFDLFCNFFLLPKVNSVFNTHLSKNKL